MPSEAQEATHPASSRPDEAYKQATRAVVDDAFRTDILGPKICAVLTNHTPASDKIRELIAKAIVQEPKVKKAIEDVVEGLDTKRKSRLMDKGIGALWGAVGVIITGLMLYWITHR